MDLGAVELVCEGRDLVHRHRLHLDDLRDLVHARAAASSFVRLRATEQRDDGALPVVRRYLPQTRVDALVVSSARRSTDRRRCLRVDVRVPARVGGSAARTASCLLFSGAAAPPLRATRREGMPTHAGGKLENERACARASGARLSGGRAAFHTRTRGGTITRRQRGEPASPRARARDLGRGAGPRATRSTTGRGRRAEERGARLTAASPPTSQAWRRNVRF